MTPPWPVPSLDDIGGGVDEGPTSPPLRDLPAMETTATELTSPGRSESHHANGL